MGKRLDFSASEALVLEAANYAVHAGWLALQQKWHGDIYPEPADDLRRNIHPRVLRMDVDLEDIDVGPTEGGPGQDDCLPEDWIVIKDAVLTGKGCGAYNYILLRRAAVHVVVTADHRTNPVTMDFTINVQGASDNPNRGYRGHWYHWQVEGDVQDIEAGQVTKVFVTNTCLDGRNLQRINGELVHGHGVGIPYFTQEQPGLNS